MARSGYTWDPHGPPPVIKQHSVAKLEVLREYLVAYFQTLAIAPGQEHLRLTLVDGFSGGGLYRHEDNQAEVIGSPLVILEAVKEAEALLNLDRQKRVKIDAQYFFIDEDESAISSLTKALRERGFGGLIGTEAELLTSKFVSVSPQVRDAASKRTPRAGRAIFFLDQYGYKDVPTSEIRAIFTQLPAAEVILTFGVDALINFASDSPETIAILSSIGIPDALRGRTIEDIKNKEADFRLYIQSCLYKSLVEACGARFFTVFFIRTLGHGDYWLVHLSMHPRARDVMTRVHWDKNNYFIHYGGAGIDMFNGLGYAAGNDVNVTGQDFLFDSPAAQRSIDALKAQLPPMIYARAEGYLFEELFSLHCNTTPADSSKFREALASLAAHGEIEIIGPNGEQRRSANSISGKDQLLAPSQRRLF
jgi:three-Cys-motif partner protein